MSGNVLAYINGGCGPTGRYSVDIRLSETAEPGAYRARMFLKMDRPNDLSSATGAGLYAVPGNPCDMIAYDDWDSILRPPYMFATSAGHNPSFNTETVWYFSGDTLEHSVEFCDEQGGPVRLYGESYVTGIYEGDNLPVNFLVEHKVSEVGIERVSYSSDLCRVTVVTASPHGFAAGDAVTISGLPCTDHSMGVNGERYNGTYRVTPVDDVTFTYDTLFYPGFAGQTAEYTDCFGCSASKWVAVEYVAERNVLCSLGEGIVVWPGHTFVVGDRVTLCNGDSPVVKNATVKSATPNAFVCCSAGITPVTEAGSVVYAPRTPIWEVPVNYASPVSDTQQGPEQHERLKKSSPVPSSALVNLVDNGSTLRASDTSETYSPTIVSGFDMSGGVNQGILDSLPVSTGQFVALQFNPTVGLESMEDNSFQIGFQVTVSTEVRTDVCMYGITDNKWSYDSDVAKVYSSISKVPLAITEISTEDNDCDYSSVPVTFHLTVGSDIADNWVRSGEPVSLAIMLYGRDGAVVTVSRQSFTVTRSVAGGQGGEPEPVPVKVDPAVATVGDRVTVYSLYTAVQFITNTGNLRIQIGDSGNPDDWVPVLSSSGDALVFIMPEGYTGRNQMTVKQLILGEWVSVSVPTIIESYTKAAEVIKLNDRLRPGELDGTVSYSATYNRDLAYNGFAEITDENSMIQNLYSCLLTRRGERLFNIDFGTTLEEMVFSLRGKYGDNAVMKECLDVISTYEPRITLIYEECRVEDLGPHGVRLVLGVEVPGGSMQTIVIPFKNRGRMV